MSKPLNPDNYEILATPVFKLKDKPHRLFQVIDLKAQFGKVPELIAVEKVRGANNKLIVRAFIPKNAKSSKTKASKTAKNKV